MWSRCAQVARGRRAREEPRVTSNPPRLALAGDASVLQALSPRSCAQLTNDAASIRWKSSDAGAKYRCPLQESAQRSRLARTTLEGATLAQCAARGARSSWLRILEAAGMMPHVDFCG